VLSTWELPACLAEYSKDGHVSNEGEDIVKRIWDLLSELASKVNVSDHRLLQDTNHGQNLPAEFDRTNVSADALRSRWRDQESLQAALSGTDPALAQSATRPKQYMAQQAIINTLPDEAMFEMESMLFDHADADVINDFLTRVSDFSDRYRVRIAQAVQEIIRHVGTDVKEAGIKRRRQFELARAVQGDPNSNAWEQRSDALGASPVLVRESVFQIVPGVSSSWGTGVKQAVWRHGYWHIARSQV
jgi:hypothetical protein